MTIENNIRLDNEDIAKEIDWANIDHYKEANSKLGAPLNSDKRVVFIGDSITENWGLIKPEFFSENKFINRGIGGQTTPQILIRFRPDVIELKPSLIVILAGTNDIAGNTGPTTINMIFNNIISMNELALSKGINVIISSVLPVYNYNWSNVKEPNKKIVDLNKILSDYTIEKNLLYLDYYSSMVDNRPGLKKEFSDDEVHPNKAAYEVMSELALKAINTSL